MRQRYLLQNGDGEVFDCVVEAENDLQDEMEKVFSIEKGYGLKAEVWSDRIDIVNYYRADTLASFRILSVSPTEEGARYQLKKTEQGG